MLNEIDFADPSRPNQDHILLDVFDLLRAPGVFFLKPAQVIGMVVMVANRDRQNLLRFILPYHEPVEMRFNVARQERSEERRVGKEGRSRSGGGSGKTW